MLPYSIGLCLGAELYGAVFLNLALRGDGKRSSPLWWAVHCFAVMFGAVFYCNEMWCVLMWADEMLDTMLCSSTQYFTVMNCIVSSCNVRLYAVLCCVVLRWAVLYFAALYCAVLMVLNCNVSSCSCAIRRWAVVCWAWLGWAVMWSGCWVASWLVAASGGYWSVVSR